MTEQTVRVEYGTKYPFSPDSDKWSIRGPVERDEAESFVKFVNDRTKKAGFPPRAYLVSRTVTITEWERANTGIVPPYLREETE